MRKKETKADDTIESLVNMGFSRDGAEDALFSCNGNLDRAIETLVERRKDAPKNDSLSSATKIVGAIGTTVFKNAKSIFNASRQKVGEVFNEFNSGGSRARNDFAGIQEEEWAKPSFQDAPSPNQTVKAREAPFTPANLVNNPYDDSESVEVPLNRDKKIPALSNTQDEKPLLSFGDEKIPSKNANSTAPVQKIAVKKPVDLSPTCKVAASPVALDQCNKLRVIGNDYFKKGQFGDAEAEYTKAIAILPEKHSLLLPLYNNRAACRLKNGDNRGAVADCDIILEQDPVDIKALLRRATAFEALENWERARTDYRQLMGLDPNLKGVSIGLARANAALQPKNPSASKSPAIVGNSFAASKPVDKFVKKAVDEAVQKLRDSNEANMQMENNKFAASQAVNAKIDAWKKNKETNIRALLSSLELILWPECSLKPCNLGELISPAQVKGKYIRAVSKLHPDKLGPNCTIEQQLIASAVFALLNKAWDSFKVANNL